MIKLRELQVKDASLMLEWMRDKEIQRSFQRDMASITLEDAEAFCSSSNTEDALKENQSYHFAIVDDNDDEYLGTISLKNVNMVSRSAEYAISTRRKTHGKGIAKTATLLLLKKGFGEFGLHRIYLSVLANNVPAIKLYENSGFIFEGEFREHMYLNGTYISLKWYGLLRDEFERN